MAHHIHILTSDSVDRIRLRGALAASNYRLDFAETADMPADARPDAPLPHAVIAATGADPSFDFAGLSRRFQRPSREAPAIIAFGAADALSRLTAIRAGFADIVADTAHLRARLRDTLRNRTTRLEMRRRMAAARYLGLAEDPAAFTGPLRITLVGDVPPSVEIAAARRDGWCTERCNALRVLSDRHRADAYVLARGCEAEMLLPELRARQRSRRAAILCLHDGTDPAAAVRALDARASDAVPLSASGEEVALRIERALDRKASEDRLRRQTDAGLRVALTDPLTGLYNRRYAEAYIAEMFASPPAAGKGVCAMMIDIDRFKEVNDTAGHAEGDHVLRLLAGILRDDLRSVDLAARLGGDEFLILMPGTLPQEAGLAAERLRNRFEAETRARGVSVPVTLSIGVALRDASQKAPRQPEDLIAAADRALYAAKTDGRNCVRLTAAA